MINKETTAARRIELSDRQLATLRGGVGQASPTELALEHANANASFLRDAVATSGRQSRDAKEDQDRVMALDGNPTA